MMMMKDDRCCTVVDEFILFANTSIDLSVVVLAFELNVIEINHVGYDCYLVEIFFVDIFDVNYDQADTNGFAIVRHCF